MDSQPTSDAIRGAQFRTVLRGVDRSEVEEYLRELAGVIDDLEERNRSLQSQLGDSSDRDLKAEFDVIGREVSGILQAAREAADSMRERASVDAARWRSEAMAEADENRKTAVADAEALRRDAWAVGSELLEQAATESARMRDQAERDVLTVMGEAEREAHRLTSGARREAEDTIRAANMNSDKMTTEAAKRRDDIIDAANRQAAAAQERTRALEQRRDELLEELENVRSTLTRLEGSLEEKRETLDLSATEYTSVRVVPPPSVDKDTWVPGETVRIIEPDAEPPVETPTPDVVEPALEPEPTPVPEPAEVPGEPDQVDKSEPTSVAGSRMAREKPTSDDLSALFNSLREGGESPPHEELSTSAQQAEPSASEDDGVDWIDAREARLLPITNRALRGTKKAIADLQNIALDNLRTDESWRPEKAAISAALQAELIAVWSESFAAGHAVAEEMTASKLKRPPTPKSNAATDFADALSAAVSEALESSGDGQRARLSAASKVFRIWRTDEAERRIRELALDAYDEGVERSVAARV